MIITSITGPTMADALSQLRASRRFADIIELRLDLIERFDIRALLRNARRPSIVTCRPEWEGGGYHGSEQERLAILKEGSDLGAEYVDLECRAGRRAIAEFSRSPRRSRLIISRHDFGARPASVRSVLRSLRAAGGDVVKYAYDATDAWENAVAFEFLQEARRARVRAVAIAMGEAGEASRVLYRRFGAWATYAAPESGAAAAPGQIAGSVLKNLYRSPSHNRSTRIFGLLGNPVAQSKGYVLHNRLYAKYDLNAVYCRFLTRDLDRFFKVMMPYLQGCSVTTPFKQSVIPYVRADRGARAIGAVNTIYRTRASLRGSNFDAPAALDAIEHQNPVRGKRLLVLGGGGTARSVLYEAKRRGARVWVANRTEAKGAALAREFGVELIAIDRITPGAFDVIVNTTSAGMAPDVDAAPIRGSLCGEALVLDAIYNPPVTRLLREAAEAGATIIPGAAMFLRQAATQFSVFAGVSPGLRTLSALMRESSRT